MNKFKEYVLGTYEKEDLQDIAQYGCSGGIGGLIYYSETTALYKQYDEDIWEIVSDYCDEVGYDSLYDLPLIAKASATHTFYNAMVWMAVEIVADQFINNTIFDEEETA